MSTLATWKIRYRLNLSGTLITPTANNPANNRNADNNGVIPANVMQDAIAEDGRWEQLRRWVLGSMSVFGNSFANEKANLDVTQDCLMLIKHNPYMSEFLLRRFESNHPSHTRIVYCYEDLMSNRRSTIKTKHRNADEKFGGLSVPRNEPSWKHQIPGKVKCSVYLCFPAEKGPNDPPVVSKCSSTSPFFYHCSSDSDIKEIGPMATQPQWTVR